jgi:hypothetical protein
MIRGVGPVYAKKLVRAFGEKVSDPQARLADMLARLPDRPARQISDLLRLGLASTASGR